MLLSWLLSSINVEILSIVVISKISQELWTSLEQQFGFETAAKKVHLKMMLNNLKKGSIIVTYYFSKLRSITDEFAIAGSPVSSLNFITDLISGLGESYYPVVVYIEANILKMSINEAYSMLLAHEARLENTQSASSSQLHHLHDRHHNCIIFIVITTVASSIIIIINHHYYCHKRK